MRHLSCSMIQSGEALDFACLCVVCQEAWKPAAEAAAGSAISQASADVPGDASTSFAIALGSPVDGALEINSDHDWYAVELVAGRRYQISLDGVVSGDYGALEDPYIYLRRADGSLVKSDDDGGPGRNSLLNWVASESGRYYLDVGAWNEGYAGGYRLTINEFTPSVYSLDQVADFLTTGFWGGSGHRWDTSGDNTITYNLTALTLEGQVLARAAFQAWANVTNLVFQDVTSGGDIPFDDNESGAFAAGSWVNGLIASMRVNISTGWLASYGTSIDSYSFQTYVHEIGHALGLGHGGPYNGSASYGVDNVYENDVWSFTIMSYFDQAEAGFGSYRHVMGPSLGDIVAIHDIYGANTTFNSGNTVYGRNATAGSLYDFANYATAPAFTIYDTGGTDTLDASGYGANQTINLNAEAFSSIGGLSNNISIARGVVIESATGGNGADSLFGNSDGNFLAGNTDADTLEGCAGNDSLNGGAGDDSLIGGEGIDLVDYAGATDAVTVDLAGNLATSAAGKDTLSGIENVLGGDGADSILGDAAANILTCGNGADTLAGSAGNDSLIGGEGLDLVTYAGATDAVTVDLVGNLATSAAGNDTLSGIENVLGGDGADSILGDAAANILTGGNGADTLAGSAGNDSLIGGEGLDLVGYAGATDAVTVDLVGNRVTSAAGNDTLSRIENVLGGDGADSILGDAAANILTGGNGADTLAGSAGNDSLIGGEGLDIVDYQSSTEAIILDLLSGRASGLHSGLDMLIGIEGAVGGQGADSFIGDTSDNMLMGNAGGDTLNGGLGADSLYGGAGNDLLIADELGDILHGGDGDDVILLGGHQLAYILALFGPLG
jgi:serralysin